MRIVGLIFMPTLWMQKQEQICTLSIHSEALKSIKMFKFKRTTVHKQITSKIFSKYEI